MQSEQLQNEIDALTRRERRNWKQIAHILDAAESARLWASEKPSFIEWVESLAEKMGVTPENLLRYLTAIKYWHYLTIKYCMQIEPSLIGEIPTTVRIEHLELLPMLEQVLSSEEFDGLVTKVVSAEVKTSELRSMLNKYRNFDPDSVADKLNIRRANMLAGFVDYP